MWFKKPSFKKITLYFEDGSTTIHIVSEKDLDKLLRATLKLHHNPGVNPHNGLVTTQVVKITSRTLEPEGRFWWSTPDLRENDDPRGALIWEWSAEETLWSK